MDHATEYLRYFEPEYRAWRLGVFSEFEGYWKQHRVFPNEYREDVLILFDDRCLPLPLSLDLHGFTREPASRCTKAFIALAGRHRLPVIRIIHGLSGDVLPLVVEGIALRVVDQWLPAPQVARGSVTLQSVTLAPKDLWPDYESWHKTELSSVHLRPQPTKPGVKVNGAACLICSGKVDASSASEGKCVLCKTPHFADGPLLKINTRSVTCVACGRQLIIPDAPFPIEVACPCGSEATGTCQKGPSAEVFSCSCPTCGAKKELARKEQRLLSCGCGCLYLALPSSTPSLKSASERSNRCPSCNRPIPATPTSGWPNGFEIVCHCGHVVVINE